MEMSRTRQQFPYLICGLLVLLLVQIWFRLKSSDEQVREAKCETLLKLLNQSNFREPKLGISDEHEDSKGAKDVFWYPHLPGYYLPQARIIKI